MSTPLVEKELTVTSITVAYELATGEPMFQVFFGEFIPTSNELINRMSPGTPASFPGKRIAVSWLILDLKTEQVPYKVGSKWKLTIKENGSTSLVEVK